MVVARTGPPFQIQNTKNIIKISYLDFGFDFWFQFRVSNSSFDFEFRFRVSNLVLGQFGSDVLARRFCDLECLMLKWLHSIPCGISFNLIGHLTYFEFEFCFDF